MNVMSERQIKVLSKLLPGVKNIAMVYHPEQSRNLIQESEKACEQLNRKLISREASTAAEAIEQAKTLLSQHDVYWMIPDRLMRSKDVVRYLFFTAREKKKVLIGLSDKYVRAGALFAFTVANESLGRQAGELSNRMLNRGKLLPIAMARDADLSINLKVAKAIGISVSEAFLRQSKVIQ